MKNAECHVRQPDPLLGLRKALSLVLGAFELFLLMKFLAAIARKRMRARINVFANHEFHHEKRALDPSLS
jgi:hypothetical protein